MKHIATHAGTGTGIVKEICRLLGAELHVIDSREEARSKQMDALILLGGADINPFLYGEEDIYCESGARERDIIEWILARRALSEELPIMGICRGHQMLTVASGGSLYQDIHEQMGIRHGWNHTHKLSGVDVPLSMYLPTRTVNSLHHQAVKTIPFGFKPVAYSPEGVVEAIWRPGALGVQWHPELLYRSDKRWIDLFEWFVQGKLQHVEVPLVAA